MLTDDDIEQIRANRELIEHNRRESIIIWRKGVTKEDPITGEEIQGEDIQEMVQVVWKKFTLEDNVKFAGTDVKEGEALVTFRLNIDLNNVKYLERNGIKYVIMLVDERGLGGINRREVVVKRVV
ncbi:MULTISPECIES: hypothetical protein [Bacillus cereus group]|uniref:hypothetical protein n=1 Tax=Bacillus cereus group TaxID=86661 RepID=UPI000863F11C|nr:MULTISPECIES: hypothetical protein [Bacillus cereus group]AWC29077.1 hypothetical protein CG483_012545 [Bacillus cytotoxicus]AWC39537.1 hypothetical protein CG480_002705 [Bacillus cytotoxicus]AWC47468.1 hypothetical protein CG478_002705 [Bacillus cytotoxicus]AWC53148.1 hypothetical protein CG477_012505 [Bacillus cytotoxicus]AWC57277.1 hypothetical protein CG476_012530 [Bacillus cytotoxicus]